MSVTLTVNTFSTAALNYSFVTLDADITDEITLEAF